MNANEFCRALTPRYAAVGGVRTHYVECGQGPTVVLIHGLSACFWNWWRNLPALAQHFRVVAFDLKGCGKSDKARGAYNTVACTEQLVGLLDHLGVSRAALVGHSMGARIALNTTIAHPSRVQSLMLVSPSCYPQTGGRAVSFLVLPGVGELYTQLLFSGRPEYLVRRALRACMHPNVAITEEDVYWNMVSGLEQKRRLAQSYLRYGRHMQFHKPWNLAERYREIGVPTLIVSGDSDRLVPTEHCHRLAQTIPGAKLEIWPGTGHLPHTEQAERFNKTVSAFLRDHLLPGHRNQWAWLQRFVLRR
ncbi:MAG TPA: alpha/beta hydrolase [Herpetosiphonaceae bacterium]